MFQALNAHHQEANCIDAASGIVLSASDRSVHRLRENCSAFLSQPVHRTATNWEDDTSGASMQLASRWRAFNALNM